MSSVCIKQILFVLVFMALLVSFGVSQVQSSQSGLVSNQMLQSQFSSVSNQETTTETIGKTNTHLLNRAKHATGDIKNHYKTVGVLMNCTENKHRFNGDRRPLFRPLETKLKFLENYKNPCWQEAYNSANLRLSERDILEVVDEHLSASDVESLRNIYQVWRKPYERGERNKDPRVRCLPYFYLAGLAHFETTDMWSEFLAHPNITTGFQVKGYASMTDKVGRVDDYIGLYDSAANVIEATKFDDYHPVITGEPSTSLSASRWGLLPRNDGTRDPHTLIPHIIKSLTPHAKIIVTLRNPADRLYSHYIHNLGLQGKRGSRRSFHHLVKRDMVRVKDCLATGKNRKCKYNACINEPAVTKLSIKVGMYSPTGILKDWLSAFPRHQIMFVRFEDYIKERAGILNAMFEFLEVGKLPENPVLGFLESSIKNQKNYQFKAVGPMWNVTRDILEDFYRPFNEEIAQLLDDDRFLWK